MFRPLLKAAIATFLMLLKSARRLAVAVSGRSTALNPSTSEANAMLRANKKKLVLVLVQSNR